VSRKTLSAILAGAVTLALMALALRNVKLGELWIVLAGARWRWLPMMAAISLLDLLIRALRWRILLSRSGVDAPAKELFKLEAIGLAVNNVLFMRLGELARAFLAARELDLPMATALASVAVERALDVAALLTLFAFASAGAPQIVPPYVRRIGLLTLLASLVALAVLAVSESALEPGGWAEKRLRPWPKLHQLLAQLAAGAAVLRSPAAAAQAAALSVGLWGIDALMFWAGARALDLGWAVDYSRSILVLSWAGAGSALPAAPGSFGTFEAAVKGILVAFGVPPNAAFGYAFFNHMTMYIFVTVIGLALLYRVGLSLGELQTALAKRGSA
jgi:uncharacterized protein (TIRG00374 family)